MVQRVVFSICQTSAAHRASIPPTYWTDHGIPNHRQNMLCSSVCRTNYHTIRLNEWIMILLSLFLIDPFLSISLHQYDASLDTSTRPCQSVKYSKDGFCCRTNRLPSPSTSDDKMYAFRIGSLCVFVNKFMGLRLFNDVLIRWLG